MVAHPLNPPIRRLRQEGHEFRVSQLARTISKEANRQSSWMQLRECLLGSDGSVGDVQCAAGILKISPLGPTQLGYLEMI